LHASFTLECQNLNRNLAVLQVLIPFIDVIRYGLLFGPPYTNADINIKLMSKWRR